MPPSLPTVSLRGTKWRSNLSKSAIETGNGLPPRPSASRMKARSPAMTGKKNDALGRQQTEQARFSN
jgi:hypothetical protein